MSATEWYSTWGIWKVCLPWNHTKFHEVPAKEVRYQQACPRSHCSLSFLTPRAFHHRRIFRNKPLFTMVRSLLFGLVAATLTSAHFTLNWPATAGFDDDNQPMAPCGGVGVTVTDDSQEITVDRFPVAIFSSHPAASWAFFATTNTQEPYNWTEIVPVINSTGIGSFCLTYLRAPAEFAGQNGIIQVIDYSADGTLYQVSRRMGQRGRVMRC